MQDADAHSVAEEAARTSYGRILAYLSARTGDLAAAEDALADALEAALRTWPDTGVPSNPDAWLLTTARNRLVGGHRRRQVAERALPALADLAEREHVTPGHLPDERLELLFVCAHPAIAEPVRAPLMLQAVFGLDAARISSAFLVKPATMGQRLSRAKAKIRDAGIRFVVPTGADLQRRSRIVRDTVYAAYTTGSDDPGGADPGRRGLTTEAIRLARLLVELGPGDPESRGLLALMLHAEARVPARRDADGRFVPLAEQDVDRWDRGMIVEADHQLREAAGAGALGPHQLQAAIQSVHNRRVDGTPTDWRTVAGLYDGLVVIAPSIGALVARAAARAEADGADVGLRLLDELDPSTVDRYQPYWAVRAHLLRAAGDLEEADRATRRAAGLTDDAAVRDWLLGRGAGRR